MDRRVKERLVGASILVVLIVLIVPELLSGPAPPPAPALAASRLPASTPEPVRNVTVDLATSRTPTPQLQPLDSASAASVAAAQNSAAQTPPASTEPSANTPASGGAASAATGAAAPGGATGAAASGGDAGAAAPAATLPASAAPLEIAPPHPTSMPTQGKSMGSGGTWAVQLGSFASRDNADKLTRHLKAQGYSVYVLPGGSGTSTRYRVRIGPMPDRGAATQTIAKLKSTGQAASLVPPAP